MFSFVCPCVAVGRGGALPPKRIPTKKAFRYGKQFNGESVPVNGVLREFFFCIFLHIFVCFCMGKSDVCHHPFAHGKKLCGMT